MKEIEGFLYLDIDDVAVAWNAYRAVLPSTHHAARGDGQVLSMNIARLFVEQHAERLQFELELEEVRRQRFPDQVSRLTGMFVFDEAESALAAAAHEGWGGHVRSANLTDVGIAASATTRVDSNWILWMLDLRSTQARSWRSGIDEYWRGARCPHHESPIWELLVHGLVTIWGTDLRRRAYDLVRNRFPDATMLLELSRLAAQFGFNLGHVSARITREPGEPRGLISFQMDMRDASRPEFLSRLYEYTCRPDAVVNHQDLAMRGGGFRVPDFTSKTYSFDWREASGLD
ncbi:hypothetical protein [Roseateles sp.]|uniref:hypothetical protein n=1 Tax=Roseateles sp. TaxID=1971397 RepID=UPI002F3FC426